MSCSDSDLIALLCCGGIGAGLRCVLVAAAGMAQARRTVRRSADSVVSDLGMGSSHGCSPSGGKAARGKRCHAAGRGAKAPQPAKRRIRRGKVEEVAPDLQSRA